MSGTATTNPLGVHALVWVGDWSAPSIQRAVSATTAAGYDLLEIPVLDPSSIDTSLTRKLLDKHGLGAACSLGLTRDADISSEEPDVVQRGEERLGAALAAASKLGASYLGGILYSALDKYSGPATARGRANAVACLGRLAERARKQDIRLGLEVVNRYETNLVNTATQAMELIEAIGEDNVFVHLDTYHMNIEESNFAAPVHECGDRLGYVHIGESHRGYLGTGTVDFASFFDALGDIGYSGTITFESFSSEVVDPMLSNTLAVWRNLWTDNEDLARTALEFIQSHLTNPDFANPAH